VGGVTTCAPIANSGSAVDVTITNFAINGAGNVAAVAPGASVNLGFNYSIKWCDCSSCRAQIQIGFLHANAIYCAYDNTPGCSEDSGTDTHEITAPSTAGTYYIHFDRSLDTSCKSKYWDATGDDDILGVLCVSP
jgi:hypothetical protein